MQEATKGKAALMDVMTVTGLSKIDLAGQLAEIDAEIEHAEAVFVLARECGFADLIATMQDELRRELIPGAVVLLRISDGAARVEVAARYHRLLRLAGGRSNDPGL
jgi:hypothetical protein